jgi:hypothetical protein
MLLPHSIGAESILNHSVSFLWLLSLFSDDHVLKVCCLVSLSFLVELFLVFSCFVVAFPSWVSLVFYPLLGFVDLTSTMAKSPSFSLVL